MGRFTDTLDQAQLKTVARAYNNAREALGDDVEIAVHCHNEFNEVSSVGIAKAVASIQEEPDRRGRVLGLAGLTAV